MDRWTDGWMDGWVFTLLNKTYIFNFVLQKNA